MKLLILTAVCLMSTCLTKNATHYQEGEMHAVKINYSNKLIYRPGNYQDYLQKYSAFELNAYIKYFSGISEQDVRERYSPAIGNATEQQMSPFYIKGKFYELTFPPIRIMAGRWYGYEVRIYRYNKLVYEDSRSFYQTPSTIKSCYRDDFKSHWDGNLCSNFFSHPPIHITQLPPITAESYSTTTKNDVKVLVGLPISFVIFLSMILTALYCYCKPHQRLAGEIERNGAALTTFGSDSTNHGRTTTNPLPDRSNTMLLPERANAVSNAASSSYDGKNDPPPSYYEVVGRESDQP